MAETMGEIITIVGDIIYFRYNLSGAYTSVGIWSCHEDGDIYRVNNYNDKINLSDSGRAKLTAIFISRKSGSLESPLHL